MTESHKAETFFYLKIGTCSHKGHSGHINVTLEERFGRADRRPLSGHRPSHSPALPFIGVAPQSNRTPGVCDLGPVNVLRVCSARTSEMSQQPAQILVAAVQGVMANPSAIVPVLTPPLCCCPRTNTTLAMELCLSPGVLGGLCPRPFENSTSNRDVC